jgi:hypothetical protein
MVVFIFSITPLQASDEQEASSSNLNPMVPARFLEVSEHQCTQLEVGQF